MRDSRRAMSIGLAVGLAVILVIATGLTAHGAVVKKSFTASLTSSPSPAITNQQATYTITIQNTATVQSLGSCNLTKPAAGGFTLAPPTTPPSTGTVAISADGNAVELRNLAALPGQLRTATFRGTATTAGTYNWGIECRQANNYSPDKPSNRFTTTSVLTTEVASPPVDADLAVDANEDEPDTVQGNNTVQYDVTVKNFGPADTGTVTLNDSVNNGASIFSAGGAGWTCVGTGASTSCTHAPLVDEETATVTILATAPNVDTTITNHAVASQSGGNFNDPIANNTRDEFTTVNKNSNCDPGFSSCGFGRLVYNLPTTIVMGPATPTTSQPVVGNTAFAATAVQGAQNWGMFAPTVPGSFCPVDFADTAVTQCNWQINLDDIPAPYTLPGQVTLTAVCLRQKCPQGLIPGAGTIVVKIKDDGSHEVLPQCSGAGDTRLCWTQQRTAAINGHLRITIRNFTAGDPKVGGICIGGC